MTVSASDHYEVRFRETGTLGWSSVYRAPVLSELALDGLDRTKQFDFEVRAVSACGAKSVWVGVNYTVPAPPPLPTPTVPTTLGVVDGIQIDWGDADGDRGDITWEVQRATALAGPWTTIAKVKGSSWTDTLADSGNYYYRVRSIDFFGNVGAWQVVAGPGSVSISTVENINQEIIDRIAAVAQEAQDRADAIVAEAAARSDALLNEQLTREAAITTEQTIRQSADDSLAQSISTLAAGTGEQFDSKQVWYFDTDLESWSGNGVPTVANGFLRPANHATDPYVYSPAAPIDGAAYRYAKARIKRTGAPAWRGELWWQTTTDATWTAGKSVAIPEPEFQADGDATIDFKDVAWPATVNRFLLKLSTAQGASDFFEIDWFAVGRPTPGASVAAVQDEATARITADSAEATQRTTLATQLRGSYSGADVAGVTSGLLYSERQARSAADGAMASDIVAIQATLNDPTTGLGAIATVVESQDARITSNEGDLAAAGSALTLVSAGLEASTQGLKYAVRNGSIEDWTIVSGIGEVSYTPAGSATGQLLIRVGNNSGNDTLWARHNKTMAYDPEKLYRVTIKARRPSGAGSFYVGLAGLNTAQDKYVTTDNTEATTLASSHYIASAQTTSAYTTFVAYFKGRSTGASSGSGTLADPYMVAAGVSYVTFMFLANYNGAAGICDFGPFSLEDTDYVAGDTAAVTAITTLDARVTTTEAGVQSYLASWSVLLDVNGRISGVTSVNDGNSSSFTVLADKFGVFGTGNALTWTTGVLSAVNGSNAVKMGAGFGSDADPLIFYYGPTGADATRTLAGAKVGITASGKAKLAGTWSNYVSGWDSGAAITTSWTTASPAVVTISVAAGVFNTSGQTISYGASSGNVSQTRSTTVKYYLYYSDAGQSGGAKTLNISTDYRVQYNNPDNVFVGAVSVTIPATGTGGGSGPPPCPVREAWVIRRAADGASERVRAGAVVAGDYLLLASHRWGLVTHSRPALTPCVRVQCGVPMATLTCSTHAPLGLAGGGQVLAPDAKGAHILVHYPVPQLVDQVEDVVDVGERWVQHITCQDDFFWVGDDPDHLLSHHNLKNT